MAHAGNPAGYLLKRPICEVGVCCGKFLANLMGMKQLLNILIAVGLLLCTLHSQAQKESKKWSLGFLSEGGFAQGDAKTSFHTVSGASLRLSIHAGPGFVTLSGGAELYWPKLNIGTLYGDSTFSDSTIDLSKLRVGVQIPIMVGYKLILGHYFFLMGEIGYSNFLYYYFDSNDNGRSVHSGGLTYAPSIGFQYHAFEVGLKYQSLHPGQGSPSPAGRSISNIVLRTGFNF